MSTRQSVITHHIRMAMAHTALTMRAFAGAVAAHYMQHVPLNVRAVGFHSSADIYADERANAQIISRMLDGLVRMPIELEESLVLSVPQPMRDALQRELAERLGLLAAPLPSLDGARDMVHAGELLTQTGEALQALAPMLADGRIDDADAPHARRALKEVRDVMAQCVTIESRLVTCMASAAAQPSNVAPMRARGAA